MLNNLYKHTQLSVTFGAIMLAIDHGRPRVMNLKELIQCFIDHRFEVLTRRTKFELRKAEARAHILEGLMIALDNLDAVVRIIRASPRTATRRKVQLMGRFGFSEIQANAILDMRLYQLTGLERDKIEAEYQALIKTASPTCGTCWPTSQKLFGVMKDDLLEIRSSLRRRAPHGHRRRRGRDQHRGPDRRRGCVITISHAGYIKRTPTSDVPRAAARRQGRRWAWTRRTRTTSSTSSTAPRTTTCCSSPSRAAMYWKKVYEIPEGGRDSRAARPSSTCWTCSGDEKIAAIIPVRGFDADTAPGLRHGEGDGQEDRPGRLPERARGRHHRHQHRRGRPADRRGADGRRRTTSCW